MKLSKKKVCGGCRALNPSNGLCDLRFKTKNIAHPASPVPQYAPTEPCYKPLTIHYLRLFKRKKINGD